MIAYLDTHVAAWLIEGKTRKLSRDAARKVEQCSLLISPIVLLELEYIYELNRVSKPSSRVAEILKADLDVKVCGLPFTDIVQAAIYEKWTRDTFDRLIVAHARANGVAALISADGHVQANYHAAVW